MKWIVERNGSKMIEQTSGFKPVDAVMKYTGQIPEADVKYGIISDSVDEFNQPIKVIAVDGAAKAATETLEGKISAVTEKYNLLNVEVFAEMARVFYTTRSDSASANYEMWKHMVANAALYTPQGLKAESLLLNADATELYSAGSALDTDAKIVAYATRKIEEADAYIVWRSNRIQQFRNERLVIESA